MSKLVCDCEGLGGLGGEEVHDDSIGIREKYRAPHIVIIWFLNRRIILKTHVMFVDALKIMLIKHRFPSFVYI